MNKASSDKVEIFVNGVKFNVDKNTPIGAFLYDKGFYALERSMRFSRPRGLMAFDWRGPEKVYVEGDFEENPYLLYPSNGMRIKTDVKPPIPRPLINILRSYFRVGGYNKWPFNRLWSWNLALKYIDRILPWNTPPIEDTPPADYPKILSVKADILIIGGGLGGLSTAATASKSKAKIVVVNAEKELGGHLRLYESKYSPTSLKELLNAVKRDNIHILNNVVFEGFFEDAAIGYKIDSNQLVKFDYKSIVFATGSYEMPAIYGNNDLPRTLLSSAVMRLIKFGVKPGRRGVIIGSTDRAFETALMLRNMGIETHIIESSYKGPHYSELRDEALEKDITIYENVGKIRALGREQVEGIEILSDNGKNVLNIDFIVHSPYIAPEIELVRMAKVELVFDVLLGGFIPIHDIDGSTRLDNVFISGSAGGIFPTEVYEKLSRLTGFKVAEYMGKSLPREYDSILDEAIDILKRRYGGYFNALNRLRNSFSTGSKYEFYDNSFPTLFTDEYDDAYVCFCTDVTLDDLKHVSEDMKLTLMEHIKRYSGVGTGSCQGRLCFLNTVFAISKFKSKKPGQVGTIRCRPPYTPIPLYLFGGEEK